jgi:hypothetical protein
MTIVQSLVQIILVSALAACGGGGAPSAVENAPVPLTLIANAGATQAVSTGTVVTLGDLAWTEANKGKLTYAWTLASKPVGSTATLSASTEARPVLFADRAGAYALSLVANDGKLTSAPSMVTVNVADDTSNDINPGNALFMASMASRAATRHIEFNELASTVAYQGLRFGSPSAGSVGCGTNFANGSLLVTVLPANTYDVALNACPTYLGFLLQSGVVGAQDYVSKPDGSLVSLTANPRLAVIADALGSDTVSGTVKYKFSVDVSLYPPPEVTTHIGQLDYARAGRTDRYLNLAISRTHAMSQFFNAAITIQSLEIVSPRTTVAKILLTTPSPLLLNNSLNWESGSLLAVSSKDGSKAQMDTLNMDQFRLRCWNKDGVLVLDVNKNNKDSDVLAAAAAVLL